MRAARLFSLAALAIAGVTCSEQPMVHRVGMARLPIAPSFAVAPAGGPDIAVEKIRGVLTGATDSSVATALVEGDSAILEFDQVKVQGDSTSYTLTVQALDSSDVVVFSGE